MSASLEIRTFIEVRTSNERDLRKLASGKETRGQVGDDPVRPINDGRKEELARDQLVRALPRGEDVFEARVLCARHRRACCERVRTPGEVRGKRVPRRLPLRRVEDRKRVRRARLKYLRERASQEGEHLGDVRGRARGTYRAADELLETRVKEQVCDGYRPRALSKNGDL